MPGTGWWAWVGENQFGAVYFASQAAEVRRDVSGGAAGKIRGVVLARFFEGRGSV